MNLKLVRIMAFLLPVFLLVGGLFGLAGIHNTSREDVIQDSAALVDMDVIPETTGTTYYVDAAAEVGNDGLSPEKALKTLEEVNCLNLKPGDQVLFKRDCVWNGALIIRSSGTEEEPISYDVYGEGKNAPVLNGNGQVYATISGVDVSYVQIRNLEVTNKSDRTEYLRGIHFNALYEDVTGIRVIGNYVHDVDSNPEAPEIKNSFNDENWFGGIIIRAGGAEAQDGTVKLHDILVENNRVENCSPGGISVGGVSSVWKKSTEVVIRGNYVKECYGNAIVMFTCDGGIIEHNVADHCGASNRADLYFVAIWTIWSDNGLIQYNEAFGQGISGDGQGFDVDGTCNNTIVQYNYSHDNHGGFLLLMDLNNGKTIVRYNVSQNDGGKFMKVHFRNYSERNKYLYADVYNNTYYTNQVIDGLVTFHWDKTVQGGEGQRLFLNMENNIFCYKGAMEPNVFTNYEHYNYVTFQNNCWTGFSEASLPEGEINRIVADPMLSYAGSGKNGIDTLNGYKLLKDSPCLTSGKVIYNNGGLDFFGNKLADTTNIGAYAGESVKKPKGTNLALAQTVSMSSVKALPIMKDITLAMLVDGSVEQLVGTKPADSADAETWFEVDISDEYDVRKVVLKAGEDASLFPKKFSVEVWNGNEWIEAVKEKKYRVPEENGTLEIQFKAIKGSKVRVNVTEMRENEDGKYTAQIAELEIYE